MTHQTIATIVALLLAACSTAPLAAATATDPVPPPKISVTPEWAGTYSAETVMTGSRPSIRNVQLQRQGTQLEASLGTRFGTQYVFTGLPKMMQVRHHGVTRFPEGGLTNPVTGKHSAFERTERWCEVDKPCLSGWRFSDPWELVPGTWTFEVWLGDKLVLSQSFEVTVAPATSPAR